MTIKNICDLFYKDYETLAVTVEMGNGMRGKQHIFTFEECKEYLTGFENNEVVAVSFSSVYIDGSCRNTTKITSKPMPSLYILYK